MVAVLAIPLRIKLTTVGKVPSLSALLDPIESPPSRETVPDHRIVDSLRFFPIVGYNTFQPMRVQYWERTTDLFAHHT